MRLPLRLFALLPLLCSAFATAGCEVRPPVDDAGVVHEGPPVAPGPKPVLVGAVPGDVDPNPTNPAGPDGSTLPWTPAPLLEDVEVVPNLDSVTLLLPAVEGARDYRAFLLEDGVSLDVDGDTERVLGATVHCAGVQQHNAAATDVLQLVQRIDVTGVTGTVRVVIEAVDKTCPFVGALGSEHADVDVINQALPAEEKIQFAVYSEAEVRATYGSLILNGHRKGPSLAMPASDEPARVLARTTLVIGPDMSGHGPRTATFFQGFHDDSQQPVFVKELDGFGRSQRAVLLETDDMLFTSYGSILTQMSVARGQLHLVLADWAQDIFATNVAYPKRPAQLHDEDYLHVSFDVASNATQRRYWWLSLCGAEQPGETFDDDGRLLGNIIQTSFFYQNDGRNPSMEGWNCLQIFPRDGWSDPLEPTNTRPESDVRVMVNVAGAAERESVRNVSPNQYGLDWLSPGWFRQMNAAGELTAPMLDDELLISPTTRYDFFVRRDRVVMYVNGEQRLCNDFPTVPLTMAEAAVGVGQVLYHSAAERVDFQRDTNDRTGQRYYLENTPFIDVRAYDNIGYDEGMPPPEGFDPALCYVHES